MSLSITAALLAVIAASGAGTIPGDGPAPVQAASSVVEIEIKAFRFVEDTVRVAPGTTVRWTNRDPVAHALAADGGEWESPLIEPGKSFELVLEEVGTSPYHCAPHPFMRGVIIVEEGL